MTASLEPPAYRRVLSTLGIDECKRSLRELARTCHPTAIVCGRELTSYQEQYWQNGTPRLHPEDWELFWEDLKTRRRLPLLLCYNLISAELDFSDSRSQELLTGARRVDGFWEIDYWREPEGPEHSGSSRREYR